MRVRVVLRRLWLGVLRLQSDVLFQRVHEHPDQYDELWHMWACVSEWPTRDRGVYHRDLWNHLQ